MTTSITAGNKTKAKSMTKNKISVLVVDDDRLIRVSMAKQLEAAGYDAAIAASAGEALQLMASRSVDIVLSDLRMPGMGGLDFLSEIKQRFPSVEVILMTAYGSVETAVSALQQGAYDYLTKPFHFNELEVRLERIASMIAMQAEVSNLRKLLSESSQVMGLVGTSQALQTVRERVATFSKSRVPLLITGETGTGKEVVARAVHDFGGKSDLPFIPVGCGTIPGEIAESELFGHEKGAFSGAVGRHLGAFERADGGTLLLDDIDDLPLGLQVKLLRVMQEGTFNRVGGEKEIEVDVRVIATTKEDLEEKCEGGHFRPDLFYRLRGLEIHLPPLRERGDDILLLATHFLQVIAGKERSTPKHIMPDAAEVLNRYTWGGNVRELIRAMESAAILARGDEIGAADLPDFLKARTKALGLFTLNLDQAQQVSLPDLMHEFETQLIDWALARSSGRQTMAAELLGVPRTTFQSKLHERERRERSQPGGIRLLTDEDDG